MICHKRILIGFFFFAEGSDGNLFPQFPPILGLVTPSWLSWRKATSINYFVLPSVLTSDVIGSRQSAYHSRRTCSSTFKSFNVEDYSWARLVDSFFRNVRAKCRGKKLLNFALTLFLNFITRPLESRGRSLWTKELLSSFQGKRRQGYRL